MRKHWQTALLCVALAVSVGAWVHQGMRARRLTAELSGLCLGALGEAAESLDALALDLEKALLAPDAPYAAARLADAAQSAAQVHHSLSLLPLSHEAMSAALIFTHRLSGEAGQLAQTGSPAADAAWLQQQWHACVQLAGQLALSRQAMEQRELALTPEAHVLYAAPQPDARPLESLAEFAQPPSVTVAPPRGLPPGEISQEEALRLAEEFVGADRTLSVRAAPGTSGSLPAHGVTVQTPDLQLNLEITRQGGRLLWMMPETASFPVTQPESACVEAAAAFLESRGFGPAEAVRRQVYDGLCVIVFAPVQQDVLLYPDLLTVQVRMDTAQVVGLEAAGYWRSHVPRQLPTPAVSREEALMLLPSIARAEEARLCVIPHEGGEALCHQFTVTALDGTYLLFISAETGRALEVRKLIESDEGTLAA